MPTALARRACLTRKTVTSNRTRNIDQLWDRFKRLGDESVRIDLIKHYMKTHVRELAERMHATLPQQIDVDDLIQQGYLGLAEAIERFDLDRDVRFETFSARRIFGSMRDYLRAIDPMPRLARSRVKQMDAAVERYHKRHGCPPTDHELRRDLDLSVQKYHQLVMRERSAAVVNYNAVNPDIDPSDDGDAMENLSDPDRTTPLTEAEKKDLKRWITRGFSRRDHLILILYYYEQLTMREIGQTLGISESRVSQRLESILACLRSRLCYQEAREELVL